MAKLYQADGDKRSRADAESKKVESEKKIQLLQTALKRYKNLHVLDDVIEEDDDAGKISVFLLFFCANTLQAKMGSERRTFVLNLYPEHCT